MFIFLKTHFYTKNPEYGKYSRNICLYAIKLTEHWQSIFKPLCRKIMMFNSDSSANSVPKMLTDHTVLYVKLQPL